MSVYLVDYENVNREGLTGIDQLQAEDAVYIFYSKKADTITFDLHRRLNECPARISIFQVGGIEHRDALDFQLVSYLGYLIAEEKQEAYFIVSRDNGYLCVRDFWKERGISVEIAKNLVKPEETEQKKEKEPPEEKEKSAESVQNPALEPVKILEPEKGKTAGTKDKASVKEQKKKEADSLLPHILAVIPEDKDARMVAKCLKKQKTKQAVNNELVKEYGNKKGGELYRIVKKNFLKENKS